MTSTGNYKARISPGLRRFFEKYEPSLKDLFSDLNDKGFLNKVSFMEGDVERLTDIATTSNGAVSIISDFNKVIVSDKTQTEANLKKMGEAGWSTDRDRIALQYGVVLALAYHAFLERLKNYFIVFIDWNSIGRDATKMHGVGSFLKELKKHSQNNDFLEYFDSGIRNSIAHFTFFWKNGEIYFCKNLLDSSPSKLSLAEFMMEVQNVGALVEGVHLIFRDLVGLPTTDNFVK